MNTQPTTETTKPSAPPKVSKPKLRKAKTRKEKKAESKTKAKREPVKKDQFGFREGTKTSRAAAMYYSGVGSTTEEVKEKLVGAHLNLFKDVKKLGFEVTETKVKNPKTRREVQRKRILKGKPSKK